VIHRREFWNKDGLHILSPTRELLNAANEANWNDSSYVLLYRVEDPSGGRSFKSIIAGDSYGASWGHILEAHADNIGDIDLLIAPHHGRDSDRDHSFPERS